MNAYILRVSANGKWGISSFADNIGDDNFLSFTPTKVCANEHWEAFIFKASHDDAAWFAVRQYTNDTDRFNVGDILMDEHGTKYKVLRQISNERLEILTEVSNKDGEKHFDENSPLKYIRREILLDGRTCAFTSERNKYIKI
jgi:hypothetical protein